MIIRWNAIRRNVRNPDANSVEQHSVYLGHTVLMICIDLRQRTGSGVSLSASVWLVVSLRCERRTVPRINRSNATATAIEHKNRAKHLKNRAPNWLLSVFVIGIDTTDSPEQNIFHALHSDATAVQYLSRQWLERKHLNLFTVFSHDCWPVLSLREAANARTEYSWLASRESVAIRHQKPKHISERPDISVTYQLSVKDVVECGRTDRQTVAASVAEKHEEAVDSATV